MRVNDMRRYLALMDKALTMTSSEITETIAEAAKAGIKRARGGADWMADVMRSIATAVAIYAVTKLVHAAIVQEADKLSPVWPACGLALAALLLWGPRVWPGVFLALFAGCAEASLPWVFTLLAPAGTTGALYAAAHYLRRDGFDPGLSSTRDVVRLIVLGAVLPSAAAGLWSAMCLVVSGILPAFGFWTTSLVYFAANTSGTLVIAPVALLLAAKRLGWPATTWKGNAQAAAMSLATVALAWLAFSGALPADWKTDVLAYLPFPVLVGVALAYGVPLAALTNLAVITIAVAATLSGQGPFTGASALVNFGQIELFVSILTAMSLLLGAGRESREREEALRLRAISREAEIERIKAQIHPHFLFNCLGAIHSLIGTNPESARHGLMHLSRLLRNSLDTSEEPMIPLEREFQIVTDFLKLQQMRFEEGLKVECRIFPNAASHPVPPMVLQPLVENAVIHGREGGDTRVVVMAVANERGLTIKVENTVEENSWVPPEQWTEGVGLRAARTRIEKAWADRATLTFHSDTPGWVTATLRVAP